jgi:uncharacterized protein (TIGR00369 family)
MQNRHTESVNCYHYAVLDPFNCLAMTGKEILQSIIDRRLPQAPISKILSFWITEVGDGVAVFEGESGPHLLNPMGTVHGGWALTLIDSAAGCAAHSLLPAGSSYSTVETKTNFSKPITQLTGRYEPRRVSYPGVDRSSQRARKSARRMAGFSRMGPQQSLCASTHRTRRAGSGSHCITSMSTLTNQLACCFNFIWMCNGPTPCMV